MIFDRAFFEFAVFAALLTLTPGPDVMLVLRNSVARGPRAGLWTGAGILSGFFVQPLLAALGVAALFVKLPVAFAIVKFAGAAYLVYLGITSLRSAWRQLRAVRAGEAQGNPREGAQPGRDARTSWREGFLTNALNPKIAVFYFAVLPQFIRPGDPSLAKALVMAATHYLMGAVYILVLVAVAARARNVLTRPRVRAGFEAASGVAMLGFGVRLATSKAA